MKTILRILLEVYGELRGEQRSFETRLRKAEIQMSQLDQDVAAVAQSEKDAEVRIAAAEQAAADAKAVALQAAADAQAAAAVLQTEIDSINAGNAADATVLEGVRASLDAINPAPAVP